MEVIFANAFNSLPSITPRKLFLIRTYFRSFKNAWGASAQKMQETGMSSESAEKISREMERIDPEKEFSLLEENGVQTIMRGASAYPKILEEIHGPPEMLYYKGVFDPEALNVALVGARKCSDYGMRVAHKLSADLAQKGIVIVSGIASGIDAAAHEGALRAGGTTVAILGSGLDEKVFFPRSNQGLARKILANGGALLSEYAFSVPARKEHFPQRNRIIAGLSKAVVVVEAALKSGSLITARLSLDQNREVCAVPGNIFSDLSAGPHRLIQDGARLIQNAEDVLEALGISPALNLEKDISLSPSERLLLDILQENALHIDEIIKISNIPAADTLGILTHLELEGFIQQVQGKYLRLR